MPYRLTFLKRECLRHFLSNARDSEQALKRGGGHTHIPLDGESGERLYQLEPVDGLTPEHIFERRWAMAVITQAMTSPRTAPSGPRTRCALRKLEGDGNRE